MKIDTNLRDVIIIVLVPFIALLLLISPVWLRSNFGQDSLIVSCRLIDANIRELQTLKLVAAELGLPTNFEIPGRPIECADTS